MRGHKRKKLNKTWYSGIRARSENSCSVLTGLAESSSTDIEPVQVLAALNVVAKDFVGKIKGACHGPGIWDR
jgi:hypothetical protein